MKYPKEQLFVFEKFVKQLSCYTNVSKINKHTLHYMCYQQFSEGQVHNWIYCTPDGLKRKHQLKDGEENLKFFDFEFEFNLYPEGCNDSHIETAVNKTLNKLKLNKHEENYIQK